SKPALELALARDEDDKVRRLAALALVRLGGAPVSDAGSPRVWEDPDPSYHRLAALAFAERGDTRGTAVLLDWWQADPPPFGRAWDILAALPHARCRDAVPVFVRWWDDVRLRPYLARALGAIGDRAARKALAERWATERYQTSRAEIGEALVALGAK